MFLSWAEKTFFFSSICVGELWEKNKSQSKQTCTIHDRLIVFDTNNVSFCSLLPAPCCMRGAACPQPVHAVPCLSGCRSPSGPASVPSPCAAPPSTLPTWVWHRCMERQRVGMVGLFLHHSKGGRGSCSRCSLPRVLLRSWPGTRA